MERGSSYGKYLLDSSVVICLIMLIAVVSRRFGLRRSGEFHREPIILFSCSSVNADQVKSLTTTSSLLCFYSMETPRSLPLAGRLTEDQSARL
jgi:hypothetical protein